jgi:hypothetical protein
VAFLITKKQKINVIARSKSHHMTNKKRRKETKQQRAIQQLPAVRQQTFAQQSYRRKFRHIIKV